MEGASAMSISGSSPESSDTKEGDNVGDGTSAGITDGALEGRSPVKEREAGSAGRGDSAMCETSLWGVCGEMDLLTAPMVNCPVGLMLQRLRLGMK